MGRISVLKEEEDDDDDDDSLFRVTIQNLLRCTEPFGEREYSVYMIEDIAK